MKSKLRERFPSTSAHFERWTQFDPEAFHKRVVSQEKQGCAIDLLLTENGCILAALGSGLEIPAHITHSPLVNVKWKICVLVCERNSSRHILDLFTLKQRTKLTLLSSSLSTSR